MSAAQPLLPGQSAPIAIITATDKSGLVLIITSLALSIAIVSILIRTYVRHEFSPRRFAWDDAIICIAMVFSIFQDAAVFVAAAKGFGKILEDISPRHLIQLEKALYASDIFYIITIWLTKFSVACLFLRLSPDHRHVVASRAAMLVSSITGITSLLLIALRCDYIHPWRDLTTTCTGILTRWRVVFAFDVLTEISLVAIALYMVYGLQMSFYKKAVVTFAFALRLPVLIAAAFRLHYIAQTQASANPTLTGVFANICTQAQIMYAITAATIPCLRPFMTATATNYGAPAPTVATPGHTGYNSRKSPPASGNAASFSLRSLSHNVKSRLGGGEKSRSGTGTETQNSTNGMDGFGIHENNIVGNVGRTARDAGSIESTESKQMIIRKDVEYAVEYDDRGPGDIGGAR